MYEWVLGISGRAAWHSWPESTGVGDLTSWIIRLKAMRKTRGESVSP